MSGSGPTCPDGRKNATMSPTTCSRPNSDCNCRTAGTLPIPTGPKSICAVALATGLEKLKRPGFGTVVLHVSPESGAGGPLSPVSSGDSVRLDAGAGRLELVVPGSELARRSDSWKPRLPDHGRGFTRLYMDHVMQADRGADLDFPVGKDTRSVQRESH